MVIALVTYCIKCFTNVATNCLNKYSKKKKSMPNVKIIYFGIKFYFNM